MVPADALNALQAERGITAAAHHAMAAADAANITCPSCGFMALDYTQFTGHALGHLAKARLSDPANPPATSARKPAPFKRPSISTCCKLAN